MNQILFLKDNLFKNNENYQVYQVHEHITKEEEIYKIFKEIFEFPDYFGENWDAFFEVLRWVESNKNLLIIHLDLPFENNIKEQKIYLEIIFETVAYWNENNVNNINFSFPIKKWSTIKSIVPENIFNMAYIKQI